MFRLRLILLAVVAGLAGCGASSAEVQSDDLFTAEDLIVESVGDNHSFVWEFSPQIARHPSALQHLREKAQKELANCNWDGCLDHASWSISHDGNRLLQLKRTGVSGILRQKTNDASETIIFDKLLGVRLAFTDLFTNWSQAQPIVQSKWCRSLAEWRRWNDHAILGACPPIVDMQEVYLAYSSEGMDPNEKRLNSIMINIHYGETAAGVSGEVGVAFIDIDPQLRSLFSPTLQGEVVTYQ